jgi:enterochelin esterase family protein
MKTTCILSFAILCVASQALGQQAHVNLDWNPHKNTQNLSPYGATYLPKSGRPTVTFRLRAPDAAVALPADRCCTPSAGQHADSV